MTLVVSARSSTSHLAGSTVDIGGTKISKDSDGNIDLLDSSNNRKIIKASAIELFQLMVRKLKLNVTLLRKMNLDLTQTVQQNLIVMML